MLAVAAVIGMSALIRKLFGGKKKTLETRKDSITGRNRCFPVPYLSRLEGTELQPGQSVIIRGVITGREEFLVNFTSGGRVEKEEENDVLDDRLLSLRADIRKGRIHLNACINNQWGKEGIARKRWEIGDEFDIRIRCHEHEFHIYIDHKLVAKFAHYVPMSHITHIYVNGDVELYTVNWEGKYYQVPYAADIPGNFCPGRKLFFSALLKKKSKQVTVDFMAGKDIAMRLQPRVADKKLVRNSRVEGDWGEEVTTLLTKFPFKRNKTFDLLVYCDPLKFMIYVDDVLVGEFEHRLPAPSINKLAIEGDVEIQGVHLK